MKKILPLFWWTPAIAIALIAFNMNPLDRIVEANAAAYYQGRVAYENGSEREREKLHQLALHGKITMYDYQKIVFPAYLKSLSGDTGLFPEEESKKSLDQIRSEFIEAVRKRGAKST